MDMPLPLATCYNLNVIPSVGKKCDARIIYSHENIF